MRITPLVSVIIPVYNSEKFIEKAINSVLSQSYQAFEILVIDDGSIDSSRSIISKYESKLTYLYQNNAGVSAARNLGIKHSQGELIAFLDSDDTWHPDKLKIQVEVYENNPSVSLIHTLADWNGQFNDFEVISHEEIKVEENNFSNIFLNPYLMPTTVMVPKKTIDAVGVFDTNLPTAEDVDFFLRCCYQKKVILISNFLVHMTANEGSLSDDLRSYTDNLDVIDAFTKKHPEFELDSPDVVAAAKAKVYLGYADELCFKGESRAAIKAAYYSINNKLSKEACVVFVKAVIKLFLGPFIGRSITKTP